jgi:hypothetical protein
MLPMLRSRSRLQSEDFLSPGNSLTLTPRAWVTVVMGLSLSACQAHPAVPGDKRTCEQRRSELLAVVAGLPEQSLAMPIKTRLPSSSLSGSFHRGATLELNDPSLVLDGQPLTGKTRQEFFDALKAALARLTEATPGRKLRLNLALAPTTDIHTLQAYLANIPTTIELEILFTTPTPPASPLLAASGADENRPESRVLTARDPKARAAAAHEGYAQYSDCDGVALAVSATDPLDATTRWPQLKSRMLQAIPTCKCSDIDADGLRNLLVAEQRAGSVALGSVPGDFLRDIRCSASMPLRSIQQVLDDIDKFDAEFAGDWREDGLQFEQVVTNERLLNYLCTAMPGETLEALQRDTSTLYWRAPGTTACQAWQFQPLSRGSPMGLWQRTAAPGLKPKLVFEYRMGGNEMRLFGPITDGEPVAEPAVDPATGETPDDDAFPCDQNLHLISVDDSSIQLKSGGSWFFNEAACRAAPANTAFVGCVGNLAAR